MVATLVDRSGVKMIYFNWLLMQHFDVFLSQAPSVTELDIVWEEVARLVDGRTKNELEVKDLRKSIETLKFMVKHLEWDNKHLEKHLSMVTKKYEDLRKKNE